MKRKDFLKSGLMSGALVGSSMMASAFPTNNIKEEINKRNIIKINDDLFYNVKNDEEVVVERPVSGKPHQGKVLLAIQAHSDDIPLFAGGLVAKLMDEGYTGYLLRTSNDDKGNAMGNQIDSDNIAKAYGMKKAYNFFYPHHQLDNMSIQDFKGRLILLIRLLKVDTIVCWDPWEHYDENPDHYTTGRAVEAARWMAGMGTDYPEQLDAGLKPHRPLVCYYYSRHQKNINRVVDISKYIDKKTEVNMLNVTKGPAGKGIGSRFKAKLAAEGKVLPILGTTDDEADFNYVKHFVFDIDSRRSNFHQISNKKLGEPYGLEWAEGFHYRSELEDQLPNLIEKYVKENAKSK
jgi:LmbE family N-acetylglucosaminyl deacetylase